MRTVLVVDDDPDVRQVLREFIELEGHRVLEAGDASEARTHLERESVDLLLLDVQMPGESGAALCQSIKEDPEAQGLRVVILTGFDGEPAWRDGLRSGADVFALKPVNRERIRLMLQELLPTGEERSAP
jgi:two-component system phosphate regulon response regulator PhoB